MPEEKKEKVFAERQDNYKQEKEQIFKDALAQNDAIVGESKADANKEE